MRELDLFYAYVGIFYQESKARPKRGFELTKIFARV
nr:MAG TPA: hypothetical protein [Caudoviricetes sp.]